MTSSMSCVVSVCKFVRRIRPFLTLLVRPPIRHRSIKNLFFVGASTHPGTG